MPPPLWGCGCAWIDDVGAMIRWSSGDPGDSWCVCADDPSWSCCTTTFCWLFWVTEQLCVNDVGREGEEERTACASGWVVDAGATAINGQLIGGGTARPLETLLPPRGGSLCPSGMVNTEKISAEDLGGTDLFRSTSNMPRGGMDGAAATTDVVRRSRGKRFFRNALNATTALACRTKTARNRLALILRRTRWTTEAAADDRLERIEKSFIV